MNFLSKRIAAFFFFLSMTPQGDATNLAFQENVISDYIGERTVRALLFDESGRAWIGTQQGLRILKGRGPPFHTSLKHNSQGPWISDISDIFKDHSGNIIVATENSGFFVFSSQDSPSISRRLPGLPGASAIALTSSDILWAVRNDTLAAIKVKNGYHGFRTLGEWRYAARITAGPVAPKSDLVCLTTAHHLHCHQTTGSKRSRFFKSLDIKKEEISALGIAHKASTVLIGTNQGRVLQYSMEASEVESTWSVCHSIRCRVTSIHAMTDGVIIGTDNGLFRASSNGNVDIILPQTHVTSIIQRDNQFWVTAYAGIFLFSVSGFEHFNKENSGISNEVLSFTEVKPGKVIVGTYNGAFIFNPWTRQIENEILLDIDGRELRPKVMAAASADHIALLALRDNGLALYLPGASSLKKVRLPQLTTDPITAIEHFQGGLFFTGSVSGKLHLLQTKPNFSLREITLRNGRFESPITSIKTSAAGPVIISSEFKTRMICSSPFWSECGSFKLPKEARKTRILASAFTDDRKLILGTQNSGVFISPDPIERSTNQVLRPAFYSLPKSASVYAILPGKAENLWASTSEGVFRLDRRTQSVTKFGTEDGLQGEDFNFGAYLRHSQGLSFFGGSNGFNLFSEEKIFENTKVSNAFLNHVFIDKMIFPLTPGLSKGYETIVQATDKYFKIDYYSDNYLKNVKPLFRYKLSGFDNDWVQAGDKTEAVYTSLPAGNYLFEVQVNNLDGSWNTDGATLPVKVMPHWALSYWAFAGYALAFILFLLLARKYYENVVIRRRATQLAKEMTSTAEMALEDLHEQVSMQAVLLDNVRKLNVETLDWIAEMLAHEAETLPDPASAEMALGSHSRIRAFRCLEQVVEFQGEQVLADMHRFTDECSAMLCAEQPGKPAVIINEVTSRLIVAEHAFRIAAALHELLQNALQHAFPGVEAGNYIRVSLELEGGERNTSRSTVVIVSDNGGGFPGSDWRSFEGPGLALVRAIVEHYEGEMSIEQRNGVIVRMKLPLPDDAVAI